MKILIDIGHPAHVHFFKGTITELLSKGHEILIVTRNKEMTLDLLKKTGFNYINIGEHKTSMIGKAIALVQFDYRILRIACEFKPDLLVALGSPYLAHVSKIIGKPYISFWDTEDANLIIRLTSPFTDTICTPSCFLRDFGERQVRFDGYKELAYLHPDVFQPDPSVLDELNLSADDRFIIVRFISWAASHDVGLKGMKNPVEVVKTLEKYGRVFISSEKTLDPELEKYILHISPDTFHSLLAYAALYIGEGGTITTEAAVLGTPAIHIEANPQGGATGNTSGNFLEIRDKYELMYFFPEQDAALEKAVEILENIDSKKEWKQKQERLLADKINVSAWMTDFIVNYPESYQNYLKTKESKK
jgi:predicted glycosyltransferase